MPVTHAIVHRLSRTMSDKSFSLREEEFPLDELTSHLVNQIKPLFAGRAGKRYGSFSEESGAFKGLVQSWVKSNLSFVSFSHKVIENLAIALEEKNVDAEGHWLFALEELEASTRFWMAHLKHKDGILITPQNNLAETSFIDFGKMGFCSCIHLNEMDSPDQQKYLTVSFGFGDRPLQNLLLDFTCFTDTVDTAADTNRFMKLVKDFSKTMPEDSGKKYQKEAADFCIEQSKNGDAVNYRELTFQIDTPLEFDEKLDDFIQQKDPQIKEEFIPDRASLKKYVRYTGKTKEVSISFSNESLGKTVRFDEESESLVITDLPGSLVKQLKEE